MKCDIVMIIWHNLQMTLDALKSIKERSNFPHRLIVIDNKSDDETRDRLRQASESGEFGEMLFVANDENIGWLKATNQGIAISNAEFVCLINNDIIAGQNWLKNIIETMQGDAAFGIANPKGNERSENKQIADLQQYAATLEAANKGKVVELDHVSNFCSVIKREVIDKIGVLDEEYSPGYYEDDDYSTMAQKAGYKCVECLDSIVFHLGSQSFGKVSDIKAAAVKKNRELFERKWGKPKKTLLASDDIENILSRARNKEKIYLASTRKVFAYFDKNPHQNVLPTQQLSGIALFDKGLFWYHSSYLKRKNRIEESFWEI